MLKWIRGFFIDRAVVRPAVEDSNIQSKVQRTRLRTEIASASEATSPALSIGREAVAEEASQVHMIRVRMPSKKVGVRKSDQNLTFAGLPNSSLTRRLASLGIHTVGDLARCEPAAMVLRGQWPEQHRRVLVEARCAARMCLSLRSMRLIDARLVRAVHRRSLQSLANEKAVRLHRDILRFTLSSRGRRMLRDHAAPGLRRVQRLIDQAKQKHVGANPHQPGQRESEQQQ
jgi:hypothetical protein